MYGIGSWARLKHRSHPEAVVQKKKKNPRGLSARSSGNGKILERSKGQRSQISGQEHGRKEGRDTHRLRVTMKTRTRVNSLCRPGGVLERRPPTKPSIFPSSGSLFLNLTGLTPFLRNYLHLKSSAVEQKMAKRLFTQWLLRPLWLQIPGRKMEGEVGLVGRVFTSLASQTFWSFQTRGSLIEEPGWESQVWVCGCHTARPPRPTQQSCVHCQPSFAFLTLINFGFFSISEKRKQDWRFSCKTLQWQHYFKPNSVTSHYSQPSVTRFLKLFQLAHVYVWAKEKCKRGFKVIAQLAFYNKISVGF